MRHKLTAAIVLLAALPIAGCVGVAGPYYPREQVVVRHYDPYYPPYAYRAAPQIVYVQPVYAPRHRHRRDRWHD